MDYKYLNTKKIYTTSVKHTITTTSNQQQTTYFDRQKSRKGLSNFQGGLFKHR